MYKNQIVIYNLYYTMVVSFYGRRQSITKKNPTEKPKKLSDDNSRNIEMNSYIQEHEVQRIRWSYIAGRRQPTVK